MKIRTQRRAVGTGFLFEITPRSYPKAENSYRTTFSGMGHSLQAGELLGNCHEYSVMFWPTKM